MKSFKTVGAVSATVLALTMPIFALGQTQAPPAPLAPVQNFQGLTNLFGNLINWFFWIVMFLGVIFILYAAFKYLTAQGDEGKITEANRMLIYALVAIGVALLARALPVLVTTFIGQQG